MGNGWIQVLALPEFIELFLRKQVIDPGIDTKSSHCPPLEPSAFRRSLKPFLESNYPVC